MLEPGMKAAANEVLQRAVEQLEMQEAARQQAMQTQTAQHAGDGERCCSAGESYPVDAGGVESGWRDWHE
jgi:hypothetical protein